jgi:hypothetical protein
MKYIQQAKFALLYEERPEIVTGAHETYIDRRKSENPISQPAAVEINGVRLHSANPQSAAEAARINEALKEASEMLVVQ